MNTENVTSQIAQLEALRKQKRLWSLGITVTLLLIVGTCLLRLRGALTGLTSEGPARTQFATELSSRVQENILPNVEQMGMQAVREIDYGAEAQKLNRRTPELAQATMKQIQLLGENIGKRGEKVLDATFQAQLKAEEKKIRADFPEANDEQISRVMTALTTEARSRASEVSQELFAPHQKALTGIMQEMRTIQDTEPIASRSEMPTWEMGLLIFDIARADLKDLEPRRTPALTRRRTTNERE